MTRERERERKNTTIARSRSERLYTYYLHKTNKEFEDGSTRVITVVVSFDNI